MLNNFKIIKATVEDNERITKFMRKYMYRDEPLNCSLGITNGHSCTNDILAMHSLSEGNSLLAVTTDTEQEEIVGIALNGESTPNDDFSDVTEDDRCDKYKKIIKFLITVDEAADVWKKTGVKKALDLHVLTVASEMRRNGLARSLVEETCKMATENGYPLLCITCTSSYSARLVEKLGMECVHSMRYDEYLGEDGSPVFNPPAPHECVKTFVKFLSKD